MSRLRFRLTAALLRNPLGALLGLLAVVAALVAVLVPLFSARYPAITDLPEHAASSAAFRHYLDPSFHFREQFTLRPLAVPYMSLYAMTAALMFVFPVLTSIKLAAAVMLLLVPAGLAVLFHGMKKSPLLGLLGLGVTWCNLTHWGFLNHMGALGLFAMAVGLTMLVLDRPTRGRQLGLALTLVALHFTHIFRQPFALAAVVGTTIVLYPATRRVKPVLAPLLPALGLFAHWLIVRPNPVRVPLGELKADFNRVREIFPLFCSNFHDPTEREAFTMFLWVAGCTAVVSLVGLLVEDRLPRTRKGWAFAGGAALVPVCCAAVFLACFFLLPLWLGTWWFVYPREAVTAAFVLLALAPDLPRAPALRALLTAGLVAAGLRISTLVSSHYAKLDAVTSDFTQITALLPKAPKLLYLIFDHAGSTRTVSPFLHMPAYVQAEKGGWLSFHFAVFGASPVAYREPSEAGAVIPPTMPVSFEWTPQAYDHRRHGPFFDWYLVRAKASPAGMFASFPRVELAAHIGTWWLYRKAAPAAPR